AAKLGAGVFAYSALSAFGDGVGHLLSPAKAAESVPELRTDNLKAVAVYGDDQMNDSRLALMTLRAAVESGASVLNYAEVTGLRFTNGRVTGAELRDQRSGDEFGVDARLVLNATGPWVDHLRKLEDPNAAPSIRLSKGAHLVLKRTAPWNAALATPIDKYRITFALPWEDMLLLGTTDEEYEGDPGDVGVTEKDTAQILDEAALSVRDEQLSRDLITYAYAGLRVLPGGPGDTSKAKRETVVTEGRGGMLSVAGGKWTTFRHIGRTVLKKLETLPGHPLGEGIEPVSELPKKMPLPGIANPRAVAHRLLIDHPAPGPRMAADTARHLSTHYGSLAFDIARLANE
ncbi:FAD-dependent oxidoreductase, partial [Streptomyces sp. NPDC005345]|uniref:glycerol-3-phosphate dehydrogenase/oxidase n=1 Tax=Streptomyces sp. NPDC005345 TaxID=3156877 RepID=UPI0033A27F03